MRTFTQLTLQKRKVLEKLRARGLSVTECARRLGVHKSTVSRELNKNGYVTQGMEVYIPDMAENLYRTRRGACKPKVKLERPNVRKLILPLLQRGWSPERIIGRLNRQGIPVPQSPETLYAWIYDSDIGKQEKLYEYLVRGKKRRTKQKGRSTKTARLEGRVFIDARGADVLLRTTYGHFETDSVLCRRRESVNTLVERMTRYTRIYKLESKDAASTRDALLHQLAHEPVQSITADNGPENARHAEVAHALKSPFYFCHPYHSWEKGTNENRNGVIRRYLPRTSDLNDWSQEDLDDIAEEINNTPMKCLQYRTPAEARHEVLLAMGCI